MKRLALAVLAAFLLAACESTPPPEEPLTPAAPPPPPAASGAAQLDSSVIITPPDAKVQRRYDAFSGIWVGTWDGVQDAKLAVRSVASNGRVTVTYAWGDMNPGIVDGQGKINANGTLKLDRFPNGINVSFAMQQDGTLAGTYTVLEDPQKHTGIFRKQ